MTTGLMSCRRGKWPGVAPAGVRQHGRSRPAAAMRVPYWRRLVAGAGAELVSTALSLYLPYLPRISSTARCSAAISGRWFAIRRAVRRDFAASFVLNVVSGLRYTRVSAEILFDMRLALYRHLQRLSPRFYARTRLGDIMCRINNDIGEIQRVAAETALAWVGNVLFLAGSDR